MSTHRSIQQIRNRLGDPSPSQPPRETFRALGAQRRRRQTRQEASVVARERDLHPLHGLVSAYYVNMSEPLEEIASWWRRFLIRLVYFKWAWYSGKSVHDMGIFTDREVAEDVARQKRAETGKAWSVKELPVNGLLPERAVRYGFYSFPGSKADKRYRDRVTYFAAVSRQDLEDLARVEDKVGQLQEHIEGRHVGAL